MTRVLIYAQTPPPLHGQSVMVQLLVDGLRETGQIDLTTAPADKHTAAIGFVHVNPQIASDLADIGRWRAGKILNVFKFILTAIRMKFRHGLDTLYFVPAPPKREALYRDWAVLFLLRPFFSKLVLHWHCIGQRDFFATKLNGPERWLGHLCYDRATVSVALSKFSEEEASMFRPTKSVVVPNGIPDPCPEFDAQVLPERLKRASDDRKSHEVLFMAGRMTPKGLFDAIEAVKVANAKLGRIRLTVAGPFENEDEKARFESATAGMNAPCNYVGWADEAKKHELFSQADCFLFPTTYPSESFGLVLAEAMAHGCPVVTTRWQAVPEVLPPGDPNVVEPNNIDGLAKALLNCLATAKPQELRQYFLARFTSGRFVGDMVRVLSDV